MNPTLLQSQFEALDPPEDALDIDISSSREGPKQRICQAQDPVVPGVGGVRSTLTRASD